MNEDSQDFGPLPHTREQEDPTSVPEEVAPPVVPEPREEVNSREFNPYAVGTKLLDPGGRMHEVIASKNSSEITVRSSHDDGSPVDLSKEKEYFDHHLRGKNSDWFFAEPTPEQMAWSIPMLEEMIAEEPAKKDERLRSLSTLINPSNRDVQSILAAGNALDLPGVAVVDILLRSQFPEKTVKEVAASFGQNMGQEEERTPEQIEAVKNADSMLQEVRDMQREMGNGLPPENYEGFHDRIAALRAKWNDFQETKTWEYTKKTTKWVLIAAMALLILELGVIVAHSGGLAKQ